ncbi:unnamed protein product, partial [Ectocarpus sp. 12 AP-2014]
AGEWGSAVTRDNATKLPEFVLAWCGSKLESVLSILRNFVSLVERAVTHSALVPSTPPPTPTTRGRSDCLDVFMVALNQACDGQDKRWYASTLELQLVSL